MTKDIEKNLGTPENPIVVNNFRELKYVKRGQIVNIKNKSEVRNPSFDKFNFRFKSRATTYLEGNFLVVNHYSPSKSSGFDIIYQERINLHSGKIGEQEYLEAMALQIKATTPTIIKVANQIRIGVLVDWDYLKTCVV